MSMLWIINWEEREIEDCYLVVRKNEFDGSISWDAIKWELINVRIELKFWFRRIFENSRAVAGRRSF